MPSPIRDERVKQLDISTVKRWISTSTVPVQTPESIGVECPYCAEKVTMTMHKRSYDQPRGTLSCSARCPSCNETSHFWLTELVSGEIQEYAQLFMRPSPKEEGLSLKELDTELPDPVVRALTSAIEAYKAGNLVATTVLCRRGLEDLMKYLLPTERRQGGLVEAIKAVTEEQEFARPLNQLADALTSGTELEKLCNMEIEPDDGSARALIEVLHSLIMYLYVLPDKLESVDSRFKRNAA